MITTKGSPRVYSACLPDTCSNAYLAMEVWGCHVIGALGRKMPPWGGSGGTIWTNRLAKGPYGPTGWQRNEGGQGTQGCTHSPAFLESHKHWVPATVGPLLTALSPNLSSTCFAPAASGKFLWEQRSSFHLSWDKSGAWAEHRREGLPCLGPRKGGLLPCPG